MKRGCPDHPKTLRLAKLMSIEPWGAVGILESLWHFCQKHAIQGDVGRWTNDEIADGIRWGGDPAALVDALVRAGWLDTDDTHRLLVHDWHDHADESVRKTLKNRSLSFLTIRENSRNVRDSSRTVRPCLSQANPSQTFPPPPPPPEPGATTAVAVEEEVDSLAEAKTIGRAEARRIGLSDLDAVDVAVNLHGWSADDFRRVFARFEADSRRWPETIRVPRGLLVTWLKTTTPAAIAWPDVKPNGKQAPRVKTREEVEQATIDTTVRRLRAAQVDIATNPVRFADDLRAAGIPETRVPAIVAEYAPAPTAA